MKNQSVVKFMPKKIVLWKRKCKLNSRVKDNVLKKKDGEAFISLQRGYKSAVISESRFLSVQI